MKRVVLVLTVALMGLGGTWVAAQTSANTQKAKAAAPRPRGNNQMMDGRGMGSNGMMGGGMMGGGMMGPMMMSPSMHMEVTNIPKGVTITMTDDDPAVVARLQKMAEAMRLMHEAMTQ